MQGRLLPPVEKQCKKNKKKKKKKEKRRIQFARNSWSQSASNKKIDERIEKENASESQRERERESMQR